MTVMLEMRIFFCMTYIYIPSNFSCDSQLFTQKYRFIRFLFTGDSSLARFRVTKLENTETSSEPQEPETADVTANISEIAS